MINVLLTTKKAMFEEYLSKYECHIKGDALEDFFLQCSDAEFKAKLILNGETQVMDKNEYATFLRNSAPCRTHIYKKISTICEISSIGFKHVECEFTTFVDMEDDEKNKKYGEYDLKVRVIKQNYFVFGEKIVHLIEKTKDHCYISRKNLDYFDKYKNIPFDEVTLRWHNDYYDGMINGVAEYQNKLVWVQCMYDTVDHWYIDDAMRDKYIPGFNFWRGYVIYELSEDDIKHLTYWHDLFCKYVGHHNEYIDNRRSPNTSLPRETHHLYYDAAKTAEQRDYRKGTPIGRFQM